jgi:DNA-binding NarL/FixJ family response regulator
VRVPVSIVEDDTSLRESLAEWINLDDDFRCVSRHANAESALRTLPAEKPAIVLVDINLPGLSGIECVRRLKPLMPETQFVMLTVYEDSNHIFEALRAGAIGYLLKQTQWVQLIAALKQVGIGGSPINGYIARKIIQSLQQPRVDTVTEASLSPRERQVLELLARGYLYKEIMRTLGISFYTVNTHVRRIYEKLHVHSRAQALAKVAKVEGQKPAPGERGAKQAGG